MKSPRYDPGLVDGSADDHNCILALSRDEVHKRRCGRHQGPGVQKAPTPFAARLVRNVITLMRSGVSR